MPGALRCAFDARAELALTRRDTTAPGATVAPLGRSPGAARAHAFCAPVVDAMMADAKKRAFLIATDATGARVMPPRRKRDEEEPDDPQVLRPVERRSCERWHVFVFLADRDHVVFRYDREHNGAVFARMLDGYRGNLLADAASVAARVG